MDIAFYRRQGMSYREIARKVGCTPRTAKKYAEHPELLGKPRKSVPRPSLVDPYRGHIEAYLCADDALRSSTIYDRLKALGFAGGYGIVQRAVAPIRRAKQLRAYVRFETEPGGQAQVDLGEFQVEASDGSVRKYYLFALILGFSRMLYAELMERCDMVSFLAAHQRAFAALGGAPQEVLYDRMRNVFVRRLSGTATTDASTGAARTQFTQSLVEVAVHYGFTPRVAPAYAAWVKGKIERPMDFVREGFWRGYQFTDVATANADLAAWLARKAKRVHGTTHERVDERFAREAPYLQPLPAQPCDVSMRLYREVRKDCTIAVLGNRYVLPHALVGRLVLVRIGESARCLRVFRDDALVVTYAIPDGKGRLMQDPRFYAALRADQDMQERKYAYGRRHKGRATISPSLPAYPIEVQRRPLADYAVLGGEVCYA